MKRTLLPNACFLFLFTAAAPDAAAREVVTPEDGELRTSGSTWLDSMTERLGNATPRAAITHAGSGNYTVADAFASNYAVSKTRPQIWDGIVGNTSPVQDGPTAHAAFQPIKKMVAIGTKLFYSSGFNENGYPVQMFDASNPQQVVKNLTYGNQGKVMRPGVGPPAGALVADMAKDSTANVLWVKYDDGHLDKFDANGNYLESPSSGFPNLTLNSTVAGKVTNAIAFHQWSTHSTVGGDGRWAVYEKNTDQVRIFNSSGTEQTTLKIGKAPTGSLPNLTKGYDFGPDIQAIPSLPESTATFRTQVKLGGYFYDQDTFTDRATVCFQTDGKLWVSDTATGRMLLFDTSGKLVTWFMYRAHTYVAAVDQKSPSTATRVFSEYLEFEVDHSDPDELKWTPKKYWGHRYVDGALVQRLGHQVGLFDVTTWLDPNSDTHTLALTYDQHSPEQGGLQVVELTSAGLKSLGVGNLTGEKAHMGVDGAVLSCEIPSSGSFPRTATLRRKVPGLVGGQVTYSNDSELDGDTFSYGPDDPVDEAYLLTSDKIILFHREKDHYGFHLGALDRTTKQWLWRAAPTASMNGRGNFDPNSKDAAGWRFSVLGNDDIFFVYRGEGWRGQQQANQIFHYKADGTFVKQFGTPLIQKSTYPHAVGMAQNMFTVSPYKVGTKIYVYTPEEGGRGVHRWQFDAQ